MKLWPVKEGERELRESICSLRMRAKEIELFRVQLFIYKINHPRLYTVWNYFFSNCEMQFVYHDLWVIKFT